MNVYVARQPIFDRKQNINGYELFYRRSMNNFYEGTDDNQSTAELINNAFLTMHFTELTEGTRAFINFSHEMLIKEVPLILPKDAVVIEIVERAKISEELIEACKKLRKKGYIIALDDFYINETNIRLLEVANIVKIEFAKMDLKVQKLLMDKFKGKIKFLAEKVETREEYQLALEMGYQLFQGYFFSKPVIIKSKEVDSINVNIFRILELLNDDEPDYQRMTEIIETDIGLAYKLLRLVNSVFYGTTNEIQSIKRALVHLGIKEIKKWIYILMLKDIQVVENNELIKTCLIRAKLMEMLAEYMGEIDAKSDYFLTGMFSSIDVLLNRDMEEIINEISISDEVKTALLGENNKIKNLLDVVIDYEKPGSNKLDIRKVNYKLSPDIYMDKYIETLSWVKKLEY